MDWTGGAKLLAYELAGDAKNDTLNLRCAVKLKLVGASLATTVFREFSM